MLQLTVNNPSIASRTKTHRDDTNGHAAYLSAFGFCRDPFPVAPDEENFFLPRRIEILITEILHAIFVRKGFACLTGEIGLGKTTICRRILRELDDHGVETALIFNTFLQGEALLEAVARDFGLKPPSGNLQAIIAELNRFFLEKYEAGINCAILIDDAQELSFESLEMIRLISNLEHNARKLVQILLVGQPELRDKLANPRLRQLASRVVLHGRIDPFSTEETAQYVQYKLASAGCAGCLDLPRRAMDELHRLSLGNPRRINILMDRCLYLAYATDRHRITPAMLKTVAQEVNAIPGAPALVAPRPFWAHQAPGMMIGILVTLTLGMGALHVVPTLAALPLVELSPGNTSPFASPPSALATTSGESHSAVVQEVAAPVSPVIAEKVAPPVIAEAKLDSMTAAPRPHNSNQPVVMAIAASETQRLGTTDRVVANIEEQVAESAPIANADSVAVVASPPRDPEAKVVPDAASGATNLENLSTLAPDTQDAVIDTTVRVAPAAEMRSEANPVLTKTQPETPAKETSTAKVPDSVKRFLATYQLEKFQTSFLEAWYSNEWERFSTLILKETGMQLVRLTTMPSDVSRRYPILRLADGQHLLFWRPDVVLESVEYGAQGEGIRTVQQRLANLNLYTLTVDGVLGWGMRRALTNFQRAQQLPLSGDATSETLFLLSQMQPDSSKAGS